MTTAHTPDTQQIGMRDGKYIDSTPRLSVGNSAFEDWFQAHEKACTGDKQLARDAYAAGMGDPLVTYAAPQPVVAPAQPKMVTPYNTQEHFDSAFSLQPVIAPDVSETNFGNIQPPVIAPEWVMPTDEEIEELMEPIKVRDNKQGGTA